MPPPSPDLRQLFVGRLAGDGEVVGLTGRVLRAFAVEYFGEWSIGHDALHLDEAIEYRDGRKVARHWAIQFDDHGGLLGYDSSQAARLRGRSLPGKARLVFDRPMGITPEIATPRQVLDLTIADDGGVRLDGRAGILGLVLQRSYAMLERS